MPVRWGFQQFPPRCTVTGNPCLAHEWASLQLVGELPTNQTMRQTTLKWLKTAHKKQFMLKKITATKFIKIQKGLTDLDRDIK